MSQARIGRIRMKAGGAEVRVLHQATPNLEDTNWRGEIVDHARRVASYGEPGSDLVGFVMVGLFSDGTASTGWRWDAKRVPVPRSLLPAYVEEIIRRDLITYAEACEVVNRANGFEPE